VAAGAPLRIAAGLRSLAERSWAIGGEGFLSLTPVELDDELILIFNVRMPHQENLGMWYGYLEELMKRIVAKQGGCARRIIVGGYLPGSVISKEFQSFLKALDLKDTGAERGRCEAASDCYTGTPLNELFMVTSGNISPGYFDRILLHESALVSAARVTHNSPSPQTSSIATKYGMTKLWPTQRFGWSVSARLARCR